MNKLNLSETERAALWQQRFFEAQAAMEKYLVYKYGYEDLYDYIKFNSDIFSKLQNTNNGAEDLVLRIAKQAECYQSDCHIDNQTKDFSSITIFHCGIWDYRKKAEEKGVELTLDSPCKYCTRLTSSLIESKGFSVRYELHEIGTHRGCRWEIFKRKNGES
jgi:hypothetical protein